MADSDTGLSKDDLVEALSNAFQVAIGEMAAANAALVSPIHTAVDMDNPPEPKVKPWNTQDLDDESIRKELTEAQDFVDRMIERWAMTVPSCWFYHQELGLALIAAKERWDYLRSGEKATAAMVYTFLGHDLWSYVLEPLCKPRQHGESEHIPPFDPRHDKRHTHELGTLEEFLKSPWYRWIWLEEPFERAEVSDEA